MADENLVGVAAPSLLRIRAPFRTLPRLTSNARHRGQTRGTARWHPGDEPDHEAGLHGRRGTTVAREIRPLGV